MKNVENNVTKIEQIIGLLQHVHRLVHVHCALLKGSFPQQTKSRQAASFEKVTHPICSLYTRKSFY